MQGSIYLAETMLFSLVLHKSNRQTLLLQCLVDFTSLIRGYNLRHVKIDQNFNLGEIRTKCTNKTSWSMLEMHNNCCRHKFSSNEGYILQASYWSQLLLSVPLNFKLKFFWSTKETNNTNKKPQMQSYGLLIRKIARGSLLFNTGFWWTEIALSNVGKAND